MNENQVSGQPEGEKPAAATIHINDYGATPDSIVVVEEVDRTVLLTEDETIVFPKEPHLDIAPKGRPRRVYTGMWGRAEIITVGLAALAVLSSLFLYLFVVVPMGREAERRMAERERLQRDLITARGKYGDITNTETQVSKLIASVDNFESLYLPPAETGRAALYQRINNLIAAYGLTNTSGPNYAPLETADASQINQSSDERGRSKFRSLFPGVYVTMTVEGAYSNLRRFLRDIETGNEFVVVSAVQILPSDSQKSSARADVPSGPSSSVSGPGGEAALGIPGAAGPPVQRGAAAPAAGQPRGRTRGETVSLRLEMAAYFRRGGIVAGQTPADVQQQPPPQR